MHKSEIQVIFKSIVAMIAGAVLLITQAVVRSLQDVLKQYAPTEA